MTFDQRNIHLIPPIVAQKGEALLSEGIDNTYNTKENYAKQFEQIILYCQDILTKYDKKKKKDKLKGRAYNG